MKTNREFDIVYKQAGKVWHTPDFVLFFKNSSDCKVAFVASKKVGNAVQRNRAKRLMRALFIEKIDSIQGGSYVLVAKPLLLEKSYLELKKTYLFTLKKCSLLQQSE